MFENLLLKFSKQNFECQKQKEISHQPKPKFAENANENILSFCWSMNSTYCIWIGHWGINNMQVLKELELLILLWLTWKQLLHFSCAHLYWCVTPFFNKVLYVWQESQQRIVVIRKESERLAQEINQSDTNKLGNKVWCLLLLYSQSLTMTAA